MDWSATRRRGSDTWIESGDWRISRVPMIWGAMKYELWQRTHDGRFGAIEVWRFRGTYADAEAAKRAAESWQLSMPTEQPALPISQ